MSTDGRDEDSAMAEVVVHTLLPLGWDGVRECCRLGLPASKAHERAHAFAERWADIRPDLREAHRRYLADAHGVALPPVPEQRGPADG